MKRHGDVSYRCCVSSAGTDCAVHKTRTTETFFQIAATSDSLVDSLS